MRTKTIIHRPKCRAEETKMLLNKLTYLPSEEVEFRHLHPWVEIFADRHQVCKDCPPELRAEAEAFCVRKNAEVNQNVCRAYVARFLP